MKNQKGFSLIELLIVVVIIGIIAAIAVPNLLASRRSANQASAIESMRLFHSTEAAYSAGVGNGRYGIATELNAQGFIDPVLTAAANGGPAKSGYNFTLTVRNQAPGSGQQSDFDASASHLNPGQLTRTGDQSYFIDVTGVIRVQTGNGANAASSALNQ